MANKLHVYFTSDGVFLNDALLRTAPGYSNILAAMQLVHTVKLRGREITTIRRLWRRDSGRLYIPAGYIDRFKQLIADTGFVLYGSYQMKDTPQLPKAESQLQLDANQKIAVDWIMTRLTVPSPISSALVVAETGSGKTYMGLEVFLRCRVKTLVIVPGESAMKEWLSAGKLTKYKMGVYYGKKKEDGDIVIAVINSALTSNFYAKFAEFGLIIYDEIHSYCAEKSQEIFWRANIPRKLGLTGTPDVESHGFDYLYHAHLGEHQRIDKLPGYDTTRITWFGSVLPVHYSGPAEFTRDIRGDYGINHGAMVDQYCSDPFRLKLLVSLVSERHDRGQNTFVFTKTRSRVEQIYACLKHLSGVVILYGGCSLEDIEAAKTARIICVTYSYGWQSISIPEMNTIIFDTPRKAKTAQIIGRILRISGDPTLPREIVDIVDRNDMAKRQFEARKAVYLECIAGIRRYNFDILEPKCVHHSIY